MNTPNIEINLLLYGAFRSFGNGRDLKLELPRGTSLNGVREALAKRLRELDPGFTNLELVNDSAFADEQEVLSPAFVADRSCTLAVLPPVCGG